MLQMTCVTLRQSESKFISVRSTNGPLVYKKGLASGRGVVLFDVFLVHREFNLHRFPTFSNCTAIVIDGRGAGICGRSLSQ